MTGHNHLAEGNPRSGTMIIMVYNNFETIDCDTNARLLVGVGVGGGVGLGGHLVAATPAAGTSAPAVAALPPGRVSCHVVIVINGH